MGRLGNILPLHKKETSTESHKQGHTKASTAANSRNAPLTKRWRNEFVAAAAEFAGTFMFLFFAFGGTQVANTSATAADPATSGQQGGSITQQPNTSVLLYIALSFGFSLMINVWVFFRVSGGLFNPAVTLGLYLIGSITPIRASLCFLSQMLAGMCAAAVVSAILPGPLSVSTTLGSGTTAARGVFLEMFLTALLVFTIFMLAAEKHKATYLAPIGIGLALFVAELMGVFYTGGSLNPARSFGPCVATRRFPGYHYIYWFGPLMGTLLAWGMYKIVKTVEYQTVNPGQDFDDHEAAAFKPPENPDSADQVERPNVAAIAAEEAVRMASRSSGGSNTAYDGIEGRMSQDGPGANRPSDTYTGASRNLYTSSAGPNNIGHDGVAAYGTRA
ncbi:aquaporin-like protein [Aaosphaeria arxii CBS 175.79]|uniref:Aquaporin-like protein n=1 Tax=Aaosphaeria arxii CBS 175.79 TaxID=1450172 RepID=A0A6A5XZ28_9PLEO|nr:aquaporin-like protein [Aaosphaeria arxii CBS 175.79]KAF2018246.1 aquaporin-like protein [Aaosphaeria arxii CBS 175.79]